jgi:hypothetical protein
MFAKNTLEDDPGTFVAMVLIALLAVALDWMWTRRRDRGRSAGRGVSVPPAATR